MDILCMAQFCFSLLLVQVLVSWPHAVSAVGSALLEFREAGLGASWKSPCFHCWKETIHF